MNARRNLVAVGLNFFGLRDLRWNLFKVIFIVFRLLFNIKAVAISRNFKKTEFAFS